jgi:hypothetical protein
VRSEEIERMADGARRKISERDRFHL